MKTIKLIILGISLIVCSITLNSCGGEASSTESNTELSKEYTSAFICPMHCEGSGSDDAGECPVCGMDYVKNEKHNSGKH
jgi:hypothetical protein